MASESTSGNNRGHDQNRVRANRCSKRKNNRSYNSAHAPERSGCECQHRDKNEGNRREHRSRKNGLRNLNDEIRHLHVGQHLFQRKRHDQKDQDRKHVGKALADRRIEILHTDDLPRNIHHKADQNAYHDRKKQIARRDRESDKHTHRDDEIPDIAFLRVSLFVMIVFAALFAVYHTGFSDTLVRFLHRAHLRHNAKTEQKHNQKGENRIEQIRNGVRIGLKTGRVAELLHAVLISEDARVEDCPCGERKHNAYRSARRIQHVSQCLSRELSLIIDTFHAHTDGQHIQIIIYKDENAENEGSK